MISFHGDLNVKQKYLDRVDAHIKADNLIRGEGWNGSKGCAVGCTLEKYDHSAYETELGLPEWLAKLEDTLFEGMSEEKSRSWLKDFLEAIPIGMDANKAKTPFLLVVLKKNLETLDSLKVDPVYKDVIAAIEKTKEASQRMILAHETGEGLEAARSAAWSAESAAESAWSAAWSARSAAWSARSAAWSARSAAWSAESAAESAARSAAFDYYADQLLEILRGLK